jgi:hypothetical protein
MTRAEWLAAATDLLRPDFIRVGETLPEIIGEVIIPPTATSMGALTILIQDLLSLALPFWDDRHKYINARTALGLEGYMVGGPDSELKLRLQLIADELGEIPAPEPEPEPTCPNCGCNLGRST